MGERPAAGNIAPLAPSLEVAAVAAAAPSAASLELLDATGGLRPLHEN